MTATRIIGITVVAMLVALPVLAQKVYIDYAHDFDFNAVETFQYVETEETSIKSNQLMNCPVTVDDVETAQNAHGKDTSHVKGKN